MRTLPTFSIEDSPCLLDHDMFVEILFITGKQTNYTNEQQEVPNDGINQKWNYLRDHYCFLRVTDILILGQL